MQHCLIDGVQFVIYTIAPDLLPFSQTVVRYTRNEVRRVGRWCHLLGQVVSTWFQVAQPQLSLPLLQCSNRRRRRVVGWHHLRTSLSVEHQGSLSTTADTVQNINTLSLHNIDLSYNSPRVSRESVECSGQAAQSRSPSPLWTDNDSVHDADFDFDGQVALEEARRRRYGDSSSDSDDVPPSPVRKRPRYRQQPELKPGASAPAACTRSWNAGRPRTCTSTWRPSKMCPVQDCGHSNTHPVTESEFRTLSAIHRLRLRSSSSSC